MKKALFFISICLGVTGNAQLIIDTFPAATRATQMAQMLAGKNVTILNASMDCNQIASAKFYAMDSTLIGLDSGVVLTNGIAKTQYRCPDTSDPFCIDEIGVELESSYFANYKHNATITGDTLLNSIAIRDTQYDRCRLEFDIIPRGDTIRFNYVFASEEYPCCVCLGVNDVFGLFISGPGIIGFQNIATVPRTSVAVSINSVFDTAYGASLSPNFNYANCTQFGFGSPFPQYFVMNDSLDPVVYNGMTIPMKAWSKVSPLDTFHLTFVIADIGDDEYDSGVFIEGGSLNSTAMVYATPYSTGGKQTPKPYIIENCGAVRLNFRTPKKLDTAMTIDLSYGGSAIYGTDYDSLISSFFIPAGDSTYNLFINPVIDNLTEPGDSIIIYATNQTTYFDTIVYHIHDAFAGVSVFNQTNDTSICNRSAGELYVDIEDQIAYDILWTPGIYLSDSAIPNPVCTPKVPATIDTLTYNVNISHAGCPGSLDSTVKVYIKHTPELSLLADTLHCYGDTLDMNPSLTPNLSTYTYSWTNGLSLSDSTILNPKASPQDTTKYVLTVHIPNGCKVKDSVTLNVYNLALKMDSIGLIHPDCYGQNGRISVHMNDTDTDIRFRRNSTAYQDSGIFKNLSDGQHAMEIDYLNQCKLDTNIELHKTFPEISLRRKQPTCSNADGWLFADIEKAYTPITYLWNNGVTSNFNPSLSTNTYSLTVTDSIGCKDTVSTFLKATDAPEFDIEKKDAYCTDDNGKLWIKNISGKQPISFQWSTGSTQDSILNLSGGSYSITVTDSLNCQVIENMDILFHKSPQISYRVKPVTCISDKGEITISHTDGTAPFSYFCSNGLNQSFIQKLAANQTYRIKVIDSNACVDSSDVFIDSIIKLSATYSIGTAYCSLPNGNIYLQVMNGSAPFNYAWNNAVHTKDNLNVSAGNYNLTITDNYNCSISVPNILVPNIIPNFIDQTTSKNLRCYQLPEGEINLSLQGGRPPYEYNFNAQGYTHNALYPNLYTGKYVYEIKDSKGCVYKSSKTLTEPGKMTISNAKIEPASCFRSKDGSIELSNSGGVSPYTYQWTNGKTSRDMDSLERGSYSVTIKDDNQCELIKSYFLPSPDSFNVQANIKHHRCHNDSSGAIELNILGGNRPYTYTWSHGSKALDQSNLVHGFYTLTLTDSKNCQDQYVYEIKTPRLLKFDSIRLIEPQCHGDKNGMIEVYVSGGSERGYSYELNFNRESQFTKQFSYLEKGNYDIEVVDINDCKIDSSVFLNEPIKTAIDIIPTDTSITIGQSYPMTYHIIQGNPNIKKTVWEPDLGLSCSDCKAPEVQTYISRNYKLTLTDENGCLSTAISQVIVLDSLPIFIPNAFSPNGDGLNDVFKLYGRYIVRTEMSIFNRWGEKVYATDEALREGWNGLYLGEQAPPGMYSYLIKIYSLSGRIIDRTGSFLLLR